MKTDSKITSDLSAQIAKEIRDAIVDGRMIVDERLPSESELASEFIVSRPTVREAFGGALVKRLSYEEAYGQHITTSTLLLSMNAVRFETACEARYTLERACAPMAAARRSPDHLATMRAEIHRQTQPGLSDESFCASDVTFHRALVDAADNPVLSYQLAGAVEAMQPLMNMITFTERSRETIVGFHTEIADAVEARDAEAADKKLEALAAYTLTLGQDAMEKRARRSE